LSNPRPTPQPRPQPLTETELVTALNGVRRRLRERNKDHGRTSLSLHLARLDLEKARRDRAAALAQAQVEADYARRLFYLLRETMEVVRPGVAQGDIDDDYKAMIAEIRRLRSIAIVDEMDRRNTGMTEIVTMQGQDVEVAVFDRPES
jgi:hypothetical protein